MDDALSICIPTYQRNQLVMRLIDYVATHLKEIPIEFVVSDNDPDSVLLTQIESLRSNGLTIKYKRNTENIGPIRNMIQSIDLSSGYFCALCCDDDILIAETVIKKIKFLKENKSACAVYGPHLFNDNGTKMPAFAKSEILIQKNDSANLIKTLHHNSIVPESAIFIGREARRKIKPSADRYFYFDLIGALNMAGDILFDPEPFYITTDDSGLKHSHPMLQKAAFWQTWENSLDDIASRIPEAEARAQAHSLTQQYVNVFRMNLMTYFISVGDYKELVHLYEKVAQHSQYLIDKRDGLTLLYQIKKIQIEITAVTERYPGIAINRLGESPLFDYLDIRSAEAAVGPDQTRSIFIFSDHQLAETCRDLVGDDDFAFILPAI